MPPFSLNDVNDVESASKLTSRAKPPNFPYFSVVNMKEANSGIYGESNKTLQQACFVLLYSITIVVALIGNILLIFIVKWKPETRSLTGVLFVNMAFADILVTLIVMPDSMSYVFTEGKWISGDVDLVTCAGVRYLNFITLAASIASLLLMSVDRYLGVTFPLDRFPNFRRGKIQSVGIWFSATITSIPVAVTWKHFKYFPNDTYYICASIFQAPGNEYKRILFTLLVPSYVYDSTACDIHAIYLVVFSCAAEVFQDSLL